MRFLSGPIGLAVEGMKAGKQTAEAVLTLAAVMPGIGDDMRKTFEKMLEAMRKPTDYAGIEDWINAAEGLGAAPGTGAMPRADEMGQMPIFAGTAWDRR